MGILVRGASANIVARADFGNRESTTDDVECASVHWKGVASEDIQVSLRVKGSTVNTNDVIISGKRMQISYSVFDADYANINSP